MRALTVAVLLFALVPSARSEAQTSGARIVAIGDIHGAYDELVAILKRAGLIDDSLTWSGGRDTLVQTGDATDRGSDVRRVLDLLMRLEREAKAAGGRLVSLMGNHEVMNVIGDLRDVTPEICASFATPQSDARRDTAWADLQRISASARTASDTTSPQTRETWLQAHPPGCLEYHEAMSANGTYGRWLREKPIAAVVDGTLFMHAGINPARPAPRSVNDVNERARNEIRRFDAFRQRLVTRKLALPWFSFQEVIAVAMSELRKAGEVLAAAKAEGKEPEGLDVATLTAAQDLSGVATWSLVDPEGPLWFRGWATAVETDTTAAVTALFAQLKITRIVVGHTPTPDRRIVSRYGSRALVIDTGMLTRVYKGNPSAIVISGSTLKAIYLDGEQVLAAGSATPEPAGR